MPVDTKHPDYLAAAPKWKLIRDCLGGREAMLASKTEYIPRLFEQEQKEYDGYCQRAVWLGATESTKSAWAGLITRKPPQVTAPASMDDFRDNVDLQGTPFSTFAQGIVEELVSVGRGGTLIDWQNDGRPYVTTYQAEDIHNWKPKVIDGRTFLGLLVLYELASDWNAATGQPAPDKYDQTRYEQWREYELIGETAETAFVQVTVKRAKWQNPPDSKIATAQATGREFVTISEIALTRRGKPVREIPFVFHTSANLDPVAVAKPPLLDIANINAQHWAASADLENGRHIAGLPTPWAAGFTNESTTVLTLGSAKAWTTDQTEAKCGFLEFQGQGLQSLADGQEEKESMMARLGSRALQPEKAEAEAFQTVEMRQRSETSVLVTIVEQASRSLSLVMSWAAWAMATTGDRASFDKQAFVVLNKDIAATTATPETITAFVAALQAGAISFETFFFNMQAREMYQDARTIEQERTAIETGPPQPPLPPQPEPAPGGV